MSTTNKRRSPGKEKTADLVRWLNEAREYAPRSYERIKTLLRNIQRIEELKRDAQPLLTEQEHSREEPERMSHPALGEIYYSRGKNSDLSRKLGEIQREQWQLLLAVKASLSKYSAHPDLDLTPLLVNHTKFKISPWTQEWKHLSRAGGYESHTKVGKLPDDTFVVKVRTEGQVAMWAAEAVREGIVDRIRTCAHCGEWFYATKSTGKFCPGTSCSQTYHRSSPEFLAKRREWYKGYKTNPMRA